MSDDLMDMKKLEDRSLIYDINKNAADDGHKLGPIQSVIRSRIRFMVLGIFCVIIAVYGLYVTLFSGVVSKDSFISIVVGVFALTSIIIFGVRMIYYSTCRVYLRKKGFEFRSIRESYMYEYKDAKISLEELLERRNKSVGGRYRLGRRVGDYRYVWTCTIELKDKEFPIVLKNTQYVNVKEKIQNLIDNMVEVSS